MLPPYPTKHTRAEGYAKTIVQDKHYIVFWSPADEQKINRWTLRLSQMYSDIGGALRINGFNFEDPRVLALQAEYNKLSELMITLVQKKHDDHHNIKAELGHDWLSVEPLNSPAFEEDIVTFQGLNKLLRIYAGLTTGVFKFIGRSTAAATPNPYTTGLATETGTRQDSTTTGFHKIEGSSYRQFSSYSSTLSTHTIHQMGIFDATTGGIALAIHDFGGNGHTHTINADSFSLGMICDFAPFGDF